MKNYKFTDWLAVWGAVLVITVVSVSFGRAIVEVGPKVFALLATIPLTFWLTFWVVNRVVDLIAKEKNK